MALKAITPEHKDFREVSIYIRFDSTPSVVRSPANTEQTQRGEAYRCWMDLDNLLTRLGESHGVSVTVKYHSDKKKEAFVFIEDVLPKIVKRGSTTLDQADPY